MKTQTHRGPKLILLSGIMLLLGFGGGYYYGFQKSPGTQTVETEQNKKNITTTVREIVKPDGSKEIVTFIVDKSKEQSSKNTEITPPPKRVVTVSATMQMGLDLEPKYGVLLQKPFYNDKVEVGVGVNTRGELMGTIGWNF